MRKLRVRITLAPEGRTDLGLPSIEADKVRVAGSVGDDESGCARCECLNITQSGPDDVVSAWCRPSQCDAATNATTARECRQGIFCPLSEIARLPNVSSRSGDHSWWWSAWIPDEVPSQKFGPPSRHPAHPSHVVAPSAGRRLFRTQMNGCRQDGVARPSYMNVIGFGPFMYPD